MNTLQLPPLFSRDNYKWLLLSLLYSLFYFLPALLAPTAKVTYWLAIIIAYAAFIAMAIYTGKSATPQAPYRIIALLALCFAISFFAPGTNALFGFAAFFAAYYLPRKIALAIFALAIGLIVIAFLWWQRHPLFIGIACFLCFMLFGFGSLLRKDIIHAMNEQRSADDIQKLTAIAERERIGRDLHDLLGHSLSSIALKAELAEKLIAAKNYSDAEAEIHSVAQLSRQALAQVRASVAGLKQRGLMAELDTLRQLLESAGFDTHIDSATIDLAALNPTQESALIMLIKEAGTNVLRHSNGNQLELKLCCNDKDVSLRVWDNGKADAISAGNGISGMQKRCQDLNGKLQICQDDNGTTLTATLPLSTVGTTGEHPHD